MKQYVYSPQECGLDKWPDGVLRLDGFEVTESAADADVFVYPGAIHLLNGSDLRKLPHMAAHADRHVFFHCADHETLYDLPSLFIRCNTRQWYYEKDRNTISWPWPVEDFGEYAFTGHGFAFDVTFHGWRSSRVREQSVDACRHFGNLKADIAEYSDFYGYLKDTDPELGRRRRQFLGSMQRSRIAICPESIPGVFAYRFFEALSAARVPLLIGSGYVLPWADVIPWNDIALFCPAEQAANAPKVARRFLDAHSDAQIIEMGRKGREYFDRYLNRDRWTALMAEAVSRKLAS